MTSTCYNVHYTLTTCENTKYVVLKILFHSSSQHSHRVQYSSQKFPQQYQQPHLRRHLSQNHLSVQNPIESITMTKGHPQKTTKMTESTIKQIFRSHPASFKLHQSDPESQAPQQQPCLRLLDLLDALLEYFSWTESLRLPEGMMQLNIMHVSQQLTVVLDA